MSREVSLRELWRGALRPFGIFQVNALPELPSGARRYLTHAIADGTALASAVRLSMHGEIRLRDWVSFRADQVIHAERGMIWSASLRLYGLPIRGSDRLLDGEGSMQWRLFGVVPFLSASGPDITRSSAGRLRAESIWLPSRLCGPDVAWSEPEPSRPRATFPVGGQTGFVELAVGERGELRSACLKRWGNPEGRSFHEVEFGALVERVSTFQGYTIPTRLRVGWYFGSERFESEGEFMRLAVDSAVYR